jgi:hypothetical protein
VTIEEIASYCEVKDCRVSLGSSEAGFITVDGTGVTGRFNNYRRFLRFHELQALPEPQRLLAAATHFAIDEDGEIREMDRAQFEQELKRFQDLVGA